MNTPDTSPWPEVATVVTFALSGVLVAVLAVMYLLVTDTPPPVHVETVTVTENFHPDNQMES